MTAFTVQFDSPLINIHCPGVTVTEDVVDIPKPTGNPVDEYQIASVFESIGQQLSQLIDLVRNQNRTIESKAADYATEIVQSILQLDDELVQKRVQRYIELAFDNVGNNHSATVFVHPRLRGTLDSWASENQFLEMVIEADSSLAEGDCRLEFDDSGLLASLDFQLGVVKQKLLHAIAEQGTSK